MNASSPILHYIYDPCGWCYGARRWWSRPRRAGLAIAIHGGGMMAGSNRQPVTDALRRYVMPHDERIAGLSGQPFGADYFDGLLRDGGAVFDSEPPTTAILAAENLAGRGLDLLSASSAPITSKGGASPIPPCCGSWRPRSAWTPTPTRPPRPTRRRRHA